MELRLLRYFVAVAEELHFGRAARGLLIAQPSLSQQIRKLERELGTALFVRNRRGVELTAAGHALLDPARHVLAAADALPALVRQTAGGTRRLAVGYVSYARGTVLTGLLENFRRTHADVDVTVRSGSDSPEVFADLRDGRIDVGVLRAPVGASWLGQLSLAIEPFHAALPAGHALADRPSLRLADLAGESFALFPRTLNPSAHDHLMGFFTQAGYAPTIGQASRRMDDSLVFVSSGAGVGLFPQSVTRAVTDRGVVFRPIVDPTPTVEIVLAWDLNSLNPVVPELVTSARDDTTVDPVPPSRTAPT